MRLVLLEDAGAFSLTVRLDGGFERDLINTAHLPLFSKEDNMQGQGCEVEIKSSTKDVFVFMRKWDRNRRMFDEEVYAAGQINLLELCSNIDPQSFVDDRMQTKKIK